MAPESTKVINPHRLLLDSTHGNYHDGVQHMWSLYVVDSLKTVSNSDFVCVVPVLQCAV